jgi:hypothetical protein
VPIHWKQLRGALVRYGLLVAVIVLGLVWAAAAAISAG